MSKYPTILVLFRKLYCSITFLLQLPKAIFTGCLGYNLSHYTKFVFTLLVTIFLTAIQDKSKYICWISIYEYFKLILIYTLLLFISWRARYRFRYNILFCYPKHCLYDAAWFGAWEYECFEWFLPYRFILHWIWKVISSISASEY